VIYDLPVENSARPADWVVQPLKQLADVTGGGTPETGVSEYWDPPEVLWVTPTDISACREPILTETERAISQSGLRESSATLLPVGTTLLTSRATVGECRLAGVPVATNQGFTSLVPKEITDSEFLFYLAQTLRPVFVRLAAGTTFMEVSRREIRRVKVCVPSQPNERATIGNVLMMADAAISKAEAKLTAARRLKIALMQQLFSSGIPDRHSSFKQTKIGLVPANWEVWPLSKFATVVSGIALNSDREARFHPRQYLTVINVQRECLDMAEVRYMEVYPHEIPDGLLQEGDIVVVEGHANSSEIGRAALITKEAAGCAYQNHLFRLRLLPDAQLNHLFLLGVLNSERVRRHWVATCNTSSGLNTINHRGLRKLLIQRPQPEEQEEIAAMLATANETLAACEAERQSLDRLKRSLLQNLLTGRVRVRI